jgi:hypothetical protein
MEELIDKAKVFILKQEAEEEVIVNEMIDDSNDGFGDIEARNNANVTNTNATITPAAQFEKDKLYFMTTVRKSVKKKVTKEDGQEITEYFGGVARAIDINVHDFYSHHAPAMPELIKVIASVLGSRCVSTTPEITFSTGGFVYSDYRQNLLPSRAEGIILSTCRYKLEKASVVIPSIPDVGDLKDVEQEEFGALEVEPGIALAANPDQMRLLEDGMEVPELDGYGNDDGFDDSIEEDGDILF